MFGVALIAGSVASMVQPGSAMIGGIPQKPQPGWAALLVLKGQPDCTGTMIRSQWVLTAAHCVSGTDTGSWQVRVAGRSVGVDFVAAIPHWQAQYPDLGLVHLATTVPGVTTLPLATPADMTYFRGQGVTVFGYGMTTVANGPLATIINKSPDGAWRLAQRCPPGTNSNGFDCYRFLGANDAGAIRNGDSGGPWVGWRNGGWHILGVVSRWLNGNGKSCYLGICSLSDWQAATSPALPTTSTWIAQTIASYSPPTTAQTTSVTMPPTTATSPPPATWAEQETPNHPVNTFLNYHNASGLGQAIAAGQWVNVSCRVYDPTIVSSNPDGWWYRIHDSPWNDQYYSPANTFMNGDPIGGPYTHNTDFNVAVC